MSEENNKEALWKAINEQIFSTGDVVEYHNVNVKIQKNRWDAYITITAADTGERIVVYVASSDEFYTDQSGLWLGTEYAHKKLYELSDG
jgi:hypothetical protein